MDGSGEGQMHFELDIALVNVKLVIPIYFVIVLIVPKY